MGLDIYLYTAAQAEANRAHNAASEAYYGRDDYDTLSQEVKDRLHAAIPEYAGQTDVPSERYPEHHFNRRYLRSSYNGSGFNRAVPDFTGQDHGLYWIFKPMGREWDGDEGTLTVADLPKLEECRKRAEQVAEELRGSDRLRVITVSANQFSGADWLRTDDAKALALVRESISSRGDRVDSGGWWSSRDLDWFGGTLKLIAAVPGGEESFASKLRGDGPQAWPCVHLVYKAEDEGFESYVQSAEIVAEFCVEAARLIEADGSAQMSWSG